MKVILLSHRQFSSPSPSLTWTTTHLSSLRLTTVCCYRYGAVYLVHINWMWKNLTLPLGSSILTMNWIVFIFNIKPHTPSTSTSVPLLPVWNMLVSRTNAQTLSVCLLCISNKQVRCWFRPKHWVNDAPCWITLSRMSESADVCSTGWISACRNFFFLLFEWNALKGWCGSGLPLTLLLIYLTPAGHRRQILSQCVQKTNHVRSLQLLEKHKQ